MKVKKLTHTDKSGNPQMVDVSGKAVTRRTARAQAIIRVPTFIIDQIRNQELNTKKGPVFQTAILAGTMGAKKTADLIPLAHPLGLEDCKIVVAARKNAILVESTVTTSHKTGVEMEALTAVTLAALTIYDMCKALSHNIVIKEIRLVEKTGGKINYKRAK